MLPTNPRNGTPREAKRNKPNSRTLATPLPEIPPKPCRYSQSSDKMYHDISHDVVVVAHYKTPDRLTIYIFTSIFCHSPLRVFSRSCPPGCLCTPPPPKQLYQQRQPRRARKSLKSRWRPAFTSHVPLRSSVTVSIRPARKLRSPPLTWKSFLTLESSWGPRWGASAREWGERRGLDRLERRERERGLAGSVCCVQEDVGVHLPLDKNNHFEKLATRIEENSLEF